MGWISGFKADSEDGSQADMHNHLALCCVTGVYVVELFPTCFVRCKLFAFLQFKSTVNTILDAVVL